MAFFEARNIHKRFGSSVVLEDINLSFEAGQVSGIMGPNGAGKTTCFNVLTGRYKPDRGDIVFDGAAVAGLSPQRIARMGISRSFQMMTLFDDFMALENVMVALPAFRSRRNQLFDTVFDDRELVDAAMDILGQVGLADKARTVASELSYGDRRALEIGVALAAKPRILFLDEPTSGLGTEATRELAALIGRIRQNLTVVMIEHDMRFLFDLAETISVIHWGQVIAQGTPDELQSNKWVRRSSLGEFA